MGAIAQWPPPRYASGCDPSKVACNFVNEKDIFIQK